MTGSVSAPSRAHRDDTRRRAALARKQKDAAERIGWATSLTTAHEEIAGLKDRLEKSEACAEALAKPGRALLNRYHVMGCGDGPEALAIADALRRYLAATLTPEPKP